VFYHSSLYNEISLHPKQWVPGGTYIIADAAYPLQTYLMKAFLDYYMLANQEHHFNKTLFSMRMVIEWAFGHLKERWRILLKEVYYTNIEWIIKIIHACCILHNICIDMRDLLPFEDGEIDDNIDSDDEHETENERSEEIADAQEREYLANLNISCTINY